MSTSSVLDSYISFRRAVALLRAAEVKDLEFGHNQISVLYKLSLGPATMGELVEATSSDKASMTRTVASLEKMGFVKRKGDENDRRVIVIELTAKGRIHSQKAHEIRNAIAMRLEKCLNAEERKQFAFLVDKIVNHLK
jgi:MarR family 2-MHQ and catechol resistance regulon transcriptional repressor